MRVIDQGGGASFTAYRGDCVEIVRGIPDCSIDYSIFSPPFASLYTYSASPRDLGNCKTHEEFAAHFRYLIPELFRVTKNGRLLSFHCMVLPTSKVRDGVIGLTDFRGNLIRDFTECGWIHHSEVVIWKDPVTAMQRTKALGLLHKQIVKDSAMGRQGIPDYLITMRKPGVNEEPIPECFDRYFGEDPAPTDPYTTDFHTRNPYSIAVWQRYASPVWMDIKPSDTLQYRSAREHADERHIAPLQLTVIRRAVELWTNPGDVVLSPFSGIGSEGVVSLEMQRRFIGIELKKSYYEQGVRNLQAAESQQGSMFPDSVRGYAGEIATDLVDDKDEGDD